ncbi:hypothetical protein LFX15_18870 [Leptospira levettii]|uniref:hypothetical protein n=1 Tax=Leptospira levettii TaxID=2023178 RepID=UPI001EEC5914|nr:hypothetical protein [Leptospira levettii]MCG6150366.1 hypothetical protein [Leptospira levettii]
MNKKEISIFIEILNEKTISSALAWKTLNSLENKNKILANYILKNTFEPSKRDDSIKRYVSYFETFQLRLSSSIYTKEDGAYIYLFYFLKPKAYDSAFDTNDKIYNQTSVESRSNSIHLILALQPNIGEEISELNTFDEFQSELIQIYSKSFAIEQKSSKFIEDYIKKNRMR